MALGFGFWVLGSSSRICVTVHLPKVCPRFHSAAQHIEVSKAQANRKLAKMRAMARFAREHRRYSPPSPPDPPHPPEASCYRTRNVA